MAKNDCYVDTSAFIAFLDRSDEHHPLFRDLFREPPPLLISALVAAEGHGWFLRKYNRRRAYQFLEFLHALPKLTIEPFDREAVTAATTVTAKFPDQKLTLADAHGLALMKIHAIKLCWSTDRHMGLTGVTLAKRIA